MADAASDADGLLSIADISRHFSLPESTTRYYCKRFAAYVPSVGEGRRRRFRKETLNVITTILEQMRHSRTASAVEEVLQSRFPCNAVAVARETPAETGDVAGEMAPMAEPPWTAALLLLERQTLALEGLAAVLQTMVERIPPPTGTEGTDELRREVETLRLLLDSSEKTMQADLDQVRSWVAKAIRPSRSSAGTG
ncbi:MAG: MerR family transcriptional regulator [Desulfovibrio sp.]|nr:MerR family transcriptional regulator [Desulfovibrio sp.]